MYKPYEKRFDKKPKVNFIHRVRFFSLKYFYRKVKYRIKYHTDYEASWSLDTYSLEWLYYHLWRYLEDAGKVIDMKQDILVDNKIFTLENACEILMNLIKASLKENIDAKEYNENISFIFKFYGELAPYLWY